MAGRFSKRTPQISPRDLSRKGTFSHLGWVLPPEKAILHRTWNHRLVQHIQLRQCPHGPEMERTRPCRLGKEPRPPAGLAARGRIRRRPAVAGCPQPSLAPSLALALGPRVSGTTESGLGKHSAAVGGGQRAAFGSRQALVCTWSCGHRLKAHGTSPSGSGFHSEAFQPAQRPCLSPVPGSLRLVDRSSRPAGNLAGPRLKRQTPQKQDHSRVEVKLRSVPAHPPLAAASLPGPGEGSPGSKAPRHHVAV